MKTILTYLGYGACLVAFFFLGQYGAPVVSAAYYKLFPEPLYVEGEWRKEIGDNSGKMLIFTTTTCPFCQKLEEFLTKNKVEHVNYVIDKSDEANALYKKLGEQGVPVVLVGANKKIVGFNDEIGALLIEESKG